MSVLSIHREDPDFYLFVEGFSRGHGLIIQVETDPNAGRYVWLCRDEYPENLSAPIVPTSAEVLHIFSELLAAEASDSYRSLGQVLRECVQLTIASLREEYL